MSIFHTDDYNEGFDNGIDNQERGVSSSCEDICELLTQVEDLLYRYEEDRSRESLNRQLYLLLREWIILREARIAKYREFEAAGKPNAAAIRLVLEQGLDRMREIETEYIAYSDGE